MGIIKKLDLTSNVGGNRFKFGQSECGMVTFNEKHRWVFPLVPTACAYAKLNEYIGKLRGLRIGVLQVQGDFLGGILPIREVLRTKHRRLRSKMGSFENDDFGNGRHDSEYAFWSCNYHFGLYRGGREYMGNLRGVGNYTIYRVTLEICTTGRKPGK